METCEKTKYQTTALLGCLFLPDSNRSDVVTIAAKYILNHYGIHKTICNRVGANNAVITIYTSIGHTR